MNSAHADFRNEWLAKLGRRVNIPELAFDQAGLCQLSLDEELIVTIYSPANTKELVVFGQIPVAELSTEMMQQMLKENRSHSRHTAPVISLSDNMDAIEVHFRLQQLELDATEDVMGLLIGHLEYWRTSLNQARF